MSHDRFAEERGPTLDEYAEIDKRANTMDVRLHGYKTLKVDDKWSIAYDPSQNDHPTYWFRHGERHSEFNGSNAVVAMFYALLEKSIEPQENNHG